MKALNAKAVLLDMDGTLVQSTCAVEAVWALWCDRHQIPLTRVLAICHGVRSREVIGQVAPHLNAEEEERMIDSLELNFADAGKAIAGANAFLQKLMPYRWAVVTSACRQVALHRMTTNQLVIPKVLVGSDDVARGKPDPEPYSIAAEKLGVSAAECIAFEDSLAGVQSASAAGCRVVQIGGTAPLAESVETVIQDWQDVDVTGAHTGHHAEIMHIFIGRKNCGPAILVTEDIGIRLTK